MSQPDPDAMRGALFTANFSQLYRALNSAKKGANAPVEASWDVTATLLVGAAIVSELQILSEKLAPKPMVEVVAPDEARRIVTGS